MSSNWIKMRCNLGNDIRTIRIARAMNRSPDGIVAALYAVASWFSQHGHYGKMRESADVIDNFLGMPGFASLLIEEGWLVVHDGVLCLRGFCEVSAMRKSLGKAVRERVLAAGKCAACGTTENLVIDHIVPVVRGGSCEMDNLQALCQPCNARKGRRTMAEFMAEVAR